MKNDKELFELKTREIEEKIAYYKEQNEKLMKKKHLYEQWLMINKGLFTSNTDLRATPINFFEKLNNEF